MSCALNVKFCNFLSRLNMQKIENVCTWNPWAIMNSSIIKRKYAVIVLNRPIHTGFNPDMVLKLWENAVVRITVDGGTDTWLLWLKTNKIEPDAVTPPELITGDMDSITNKALQYFSSNGITKIIVTEDQNNTDFTKSVIELQRYITQNDLELDDVMVFTASSGRFDQLLSNVNTLFYARKLLPSVKMYILATDSLTWLLPEGGHNILIPVKLRKQQEWCALLPIGAPCQVTTTGLKWNLTKKILEFGHLVSSSNTYNGDPEVFIQSDGSLIWSMGIDTIFCEPLDEYHDILKTGF